MLTTGRIAFLVLAALTLTAISRAADRQAGYQHGQQLEQAGKTDEAFLEYAGTPGCQHLAVGLARSEPSRYLALLNTAGGTIPRPLAKAVEADLRLAMGDKHAALACCRAVAACVAERPEDSWESGKIPADSYLAEPPLRREGEFIVHGPVEAFSRGPGSHRDNWLIRRWIALEAWDDAGTEFARVWEIHRRYARPHLIERAESDAKASVKQTRQLIRPAGFDSRGLQFAIDYAFFLRKIEDRKGAIAVLREPLLAMDMDRDPNRPRIVAADADVQVAILPLRTPSHFASPWPVGIARKEFIRLAFGVFKDDGRLDSLVEDLQRRIDRGENRLRRVLARLRMLEGRPDEVLALELAYIEA
ncbi:MAG: hypothetical protein JJ992_00180, partial [Planctomycetes bacterium]|nr:hypothetical protein [Planctomycetota bacterium]